MTKSTHSLSVNNSYSQALYELVEEEKSIEQVEKEAGSIIKLISESPEFNNLIKDPRNTQTEQTNVISIICENYKINITFIKFLKFLISKRRFFFLDKILKDFLSICSIKRGEILARLTAAKELSNLELENIKNSLKENFGSNLKLKFIHDPSLLGGLIIQIGSIMIDTSIKNKLKQIENNMVEA
ncbi:MAG: ATP synthase F1 subunit delta [Candidatus Pelagibacter sp. TMED118]|nr:MAG: ATP synthase F1 subunit delta [Candidatus Pelagibacter sp. TMED118]